MIKKILFSLFLISLVSSVSGAFYVVSNLPGTERDFSSIQSAIEHAAPYDTIYVKGSPTNYGNVLLEKPLVLIGEGFSGEIHSGHTAKLTRILFTANPYRRTISSGSVIIGFEFPFFPGQRANIVTVANGHTKIQDVVMERNWFWFAEIAGSAENWVFRNNIIRGWVKGGAGNGNGGAAGFHFHNNILNSLMEFQRGELTIENNIILGRLKDISDAQVANNIFTREDYFLEEVYGSRFFNNIAMGEKIGKEDCYSNPASFESEYLCEGSANTGSSNRVAFDPGFVYWPSNDIMGGSVFKLAQGSPARSSGRRGAEIGIFGGTHPFPVNAFMNPEIDDPFPTFVTSIY